MSTQWVQSRYSDKGEKWEVMHECEADYKVRGHAKGNGKEYAHYLPRSEYVVCLPPETWTDVTEACRVVSWSRPDRETPVLVLYHDSMLVSNENGYRLSKVQLWTVQPQTNILGEAQLAFIVERKDRP